MKRIFLVAAFLFAVNLQAQDLRPVVNKTLTFWNTAGTQVHKFAGTTGTAALDTVVSEFIPLDADEYKFSIAAGLGDTMKANVGYQLVAGAPTGNGFYARGGIALVAVDSIISLGVQQAIVGQTGKLLLTGHGFPVGHTSTPGGYQSNRDSTWTNTLGSSAAISAYSGFRIVLVQYAGLRDVSNTTILDQNRLVIRRH